MAVELSHPISRAMLSLLLISFCSNFVNAQGPRLIVEDGHIWIKNLDAEVLYTFSRYFNSQEDWESVFPVTTKDTSHGIVIPGTYEVFKDAVRFTPRFPFAQHVVYVAKFDAAQLSGNTNEVYLPKMNEDYLELEFSSSKASQPVAQVTAIYPSGSILPENLLKLHLSFSKPMTLGEVYNKVKLLDANGKDVEKPFLIVDQEFWNDDMTVVTILFDPGRIKRGLRPNLEMKPALKEGEQYTLIVEEGWKDIDGLLTARTISKTFRCISADRQSPIASSYQVAPPLFETSPLVINLKESHDYILLTKAVKIFDDQGNLVDGTVVVKDNESSIAFVPKAPWVQMEYTIQINPLLEDLAGNNLNRLFDEDVTSRSSTPLRVHQLNFRFSKSAH